MKNANWARIAVAASAALGLGAMSSSASAQYGNPQYCSNVAWVVCSWDGARRIEPTIECVEAEYEACMAGYGSLSAKQPMIGDRRHEVQPA